MTPRGHFPGRASADWFAVTFAFGSRSYSRSKHRMAKTAGDIIVETLIDWGVNTIFGIPGDGVNGIIESLRKNQEKIKFIQTRHEEAAAFAACGYAKVTNRLGV